MPSLYIPHGGGPAFFMQGAMELTFRSMAAFLASVGVQLPAKPKALLVITAHWESRVATLTGSPQPDLIYDYYGFPPEAYAILYPAAGAPALAQQAAAHVRQAGMECMVSPDHGWDHGVFVPLKVMFPDADIPVVAMSLLQSLDPAAHIALGRALAPLRNEGVLIVGSGMSYHNLRQFDNASAASVAFDTWLDGALSGDAAHRQMQLTQWATAPSARAAHPREEHLLPLMVASGAGGDAPARKIWSEMVGGSQVSAWGFA